MKNFPMNSKRKTHFCCIDCQQNVSFINKVEEEKKGLLRP